jgi:hypothetical protein
VERAGKAIVAGIERRSRRVYAPGLVGPMLPLRQLLAPVIEQQMRLTGVVRKVEQLDARVEQPLDSTRAG